MKTGRVLLYLIFFGGAVLFFAFSLFPEENAGRALSGKFNTMFEKTVMQCGAARLSFPRHLVVDQSNITWLDTVSTELELLHLSPAWSSVFKGRKDIVFSAGLRQGKIDGKINGVSFGESSFSTLDLTLADARVDGFPYDTAQNKMRVSFDAAGRFSYVRETETLAGDGILSGFSVDLSKDSALARAGLPTVEFSRVDLAFEIKDDVLIFKKMAARGPVVDIDLTGTIGPLTGPAVSLEGRLRPAPSLVSKLSKVASVKNMFQKTNQKGLPIKISGDMANPRIRFN